MIQMNETHAWDIISKRLQNNKNVHLSLTNPKELSPVINKSLDKSKVSHENSAEIEATPFQSIILPIIVVA